jgi:uncharacterized protein (TIGR04255 family)
VHTLPRAAVLTQEDNLPRPDGLPDFTSPPLTEVVASIQFATPSKYSEAYVREIWALFEGEFPNVQEMPPLPPVFEVFGGPELPALRLNFGVITGAIRSRYWFLSKDQTALIQFQQDRFIRNWRKVQTQKNEYPHFETIITKYASELETLQKYFESKSWGKIAATQCELTYVNQMSLTDEHGAPLPKSFYFRKADLSLDGDVTDLAINLRTTVTGNDGKPIGRLVVEGSTGVDNEGNSVLALNLVVRGAPANASITSALEFLHHGRQVIDKTFVAFTSDAAHKKWGRTR